MNDDFSTPEALAVLFDLTREINRQREQNNMDEAAKLGAALKRLGRIFGILQQDPESFLRGELQDELIDKINALITDRNAARQKKDWVQADRARDKLSEMGVSIEDTAEGTIWRKEG